MSKEGSQESKYKHHHTTQKSHTSCLLTGAEETENTVKLDKSACKNTENTIGIEGILNMKMSLKNNDSAMYNSMEN